MKNKPVKMRCGAKARSNNYAPCQKYPLTGKTRCKLHGGRNTGYKSPEGLRNISEVNTTHGLFTVESKAQKRAIREMLNWRKDLCN